MTMLRIIKWLAALGGLCVVLVLGLALFLPRIVDSQAVRDKIRAFLLTKTNGNVAIENIDLKWFPRPAVVIRGASLAFGDKVGGKVQSLEVYPSLRGLLTGNLDISRVEVASPALSVRLPEPGEEPFNIDEIEGQIRSLLASMASAIPGMAVTVSGASAEVRIGDRPLVMITGLDGRLVAPPGEMNLQFSSRANIFDSLRVEGRINGETLTTKGQIKVENLRLEESMASLLPWLDDYVESGKLNLNLSLTSVGLKNIKAEIAGALPSLELVRRDRKAAIEGSTFKGVISRTDGIVNAVIERLDLASPRLTVTGELTVDPASASSSSLKLVGKDLDVSPVREWTLKFAGDVPVVEDIFRHVKSGQVPELSFQASGQSFAELWHNIDLTGTLRGGNIFAYVLGINLDDVNGQFAVSHGLLEAKQFSARFGKIQGKDGALRLGLEGNSAPFHLDIMVQADAAELQSFLLRAVKDEGFRKELSRIHNIEGELSGRVILGERIGSLFPNVSIFNAAISGAYDLIPYPISVKEGRFQYGDGKVALGNVSGAVGASSFSELTGSLNYNDPRQIEVSSGKFSLDVAQTKNLLNRFGVVPEKLRDIDSAQGRLDVSALTLKGPLEEPSRWNFTGAGSFSKIAVKQAKLPGVVNLSGGKFSATPTKLTVSNVRADLLDASLTIGGSLEGFMDAPLNLDATATGTIGALMNEWLGRQMELPKQFMLRPPLQVSNGRLLWKEGGDVAFQGSMTVGGGPQLSLDLVRGLQGIEAKQIMIADRGQSAHMTLDLKKENFGFSFNGNLEQETLNRIFQTSPLEGSLIQGDIEVSVFEAPLRFNARGRLSGRELRLPLQDETAVVEFFFLEADPGGINVRSANVVWRESRLSLMGKVLPDANALWLDMAISADRVVWEEVDELVKRGGKSGDSEGVLGRALPPLEGTLRLKADDFTLAGFSSSPFQAVASLSQNTVNVQIEHADVCGIAAVGNVDVASGQIGLDVSLSVTGGQLEPTSSCLSDNKQVVRGNYSLTGRLTGRGTPEKIAQTLRGDFNFSARDGEILQTPTTDTPLEAAFNYLNQTGDFSVDFPDLDRESFPFRAITARGTVEGTTLVNDEVTLRSSLYAIAGTGRVDVGDRQVDARGLITVLLPGNRLIRRIPVFGSLLTGSIVGIPIRITGSLDRPDITYLSPTDVGAELLHIPMRILGLPLEAIRLFTPNAWQ
jgi:AsmA-like C-terminal region